MTLRAHFDTQLAALRSRLFLMSGRVRDEFALAYHALVNRDREAIETVYAQDREVDQLCAQIERSCFSLISLQQPVAKDLRLIITVFNINTDLERMGDQAKGIARVTERLLAIPSAWFPPHGLDAMHQKAQFMHDETFKAWDEQNVPRLERVVASDDAVDAWDVEVQSELFSRMAGTAQATDIEALYELLRASREVERFADLVCNIARDITSYVRDTQFRANV